MSDAILLSTGSLRSEKPFPLLSTTTSQPITLHLKSQTTTQKQTNYHHQKPFTTMRTTLNAVVFLLAFTDAFVPHQLLSRVSLRLHSDTQEESSTASTAVPETGEVGLLTFDLDDTLYPIEPVSYTHLTLPTKA